MREISSLGYIPENLAFKLLSKIYILPLVGMFAIVPLKGLLLCWNKKPQLTARMSDFLLLGLITTSVQTLVVTLFLLAQVNPIWATVFAVEIAVIVDYSQSRWWTWRDKFYNLSSAKQWTTTLLLFPLYNALTPTVYIRIWGAIESESRGIPFWQSWILFLVIGICVNFPVYHLIVFRLAMHILDKVSKTATLKSDAVAFE